MTLQIVVSFFVYTFSQNLRDKLIAYFLRKSGIELSQDQADEYLHSMAGLYSLLSQTRTRSPFASPEQKRRDRIT